MSDDTVMGWQDSNAGITLSGNDGATHNVGLSPLFFGRIGRVFGWASGWVMTTAWRGDTNYLWSSDSQLEELRSYYLIINPDQIRPSAYNNTTFGFSLRCLVSTS